MNMIRSFAGLFSPRLMAQSLAGLACLIAVSASAQWQWLDKDGRKVYSDRPPPADILDKNVLKRPAGRPAPSAAANAQNGGDAANVDPAAAGAAGPNAGNVPKLPGVDKELEQKKKLAADAEAAKRKAAEEQVTKAKAENCARAKQSKVTLDSGVRIRRTNEQGEREVMDDQARASEARRVQDIIDASCA